MKIQKATIAIALSVVVALSATGVVFAEGSNEVRPTNASTSGIRRLEETVKERVTNIKEKVSEKRDAKKEAIVTRVRKAVDARETALSRSLDLAGKILDKLQIRIDAAKNAGKDVTSMSAAMTDARSKLADAKTRLANVDAQKGTAVDKAGFQAIETQFKAIRQDIHAIREDASKIIRTLKSFNSATSEGKNWQKEGSKSAHPATNSAEKD